MSFLCGENNQDQDARPRTRLFRLQQYPTDQLGSRLSNPALRPIGVDPAPRSLLDADVAIVELIAVVGVDLGEKING